VQINMNDVELHGQPKYLTRTLGEKEYALKIYATFIPLTLRREKNFFQVIKPTQTQYEQLELHGQQQYLTGTLKEKDYALKIDTM
jgi:hypothetical protein